VIKYSIKYDCIFNESFSFVKVITQTLMMFAELLINFSVC